MKGLRLRNWGNYHRMAKVKEVDHVKYEARALYQGIYTIHCRWGDNRCKYTEDFEKGEMFNFTAISTWAPRV